MDFEEYIEYYYSLSKDNGTECHIDISGMANCREKFSDKEISDYLLRCDIDEVLGLLKKETADRITDQISLFNRHYEMIMQADPTSPYFLEDHGAIIHMNNISTRLMLVQSPIGSGFRYDDLCCRIYLSFYPEMIFVNHITTGIQVINGLYEVDNSTEMRTRMYMKSLPKRVDKENIVEFARKPGLYSTATRLYTENQRFISELR